jgi:hypothetical protein
MSQQLVDLHKETTVDFEYNNNLGTGYSVTYLTYIAANNIDNNIGIG